MKSTIRILFTNINFVLLIVPFSMLYSIYMALGSIVSIMCAKFGYDANQSSYFGLFFIIFGVIGSMIHAMICDKRKTFKK